MPGSQLLWRATTRVGFGISDNYVAAVFSSPGNWPQNQEAFIMNVCEVDGCSFERTVRCNCIEYYDMYTDRCIECDYLMAYNPYAGKCDYVSLLDPSLQ